MPLSLQGKLNLKSLVKAVCQCVGDFKHEMCLTSIDNMTHSLPARLLPFNLCNRTLETIISDRNAFFVLWASYIAPYYTSSILGGANNSTERPMCYKQGHILMAFCPLSDTTLNLLSYQKNIKSVYFIICYTNTSLEIQNSWSVANK